MYVSLFKASFHERQRRLGEKAQIRGARRRNGGSRLELVAKLVQVQLLVTEFYSHSITTKVLWFHSKDIDIEIDGPGDISYGEHYVIQ